MSSVLRVAWLVAALAFAALWIGRSLGPALDPQVVQDDARQHVFWMQRLVDPTILRDDLYADYFASQAPPGYVLLFRVLMTFADPLPASKLLPPLLGLLAAAFTFLLVERLARSRPAAFLATVLGSWYVWQYDDLPTGSPRAFLLPLTAMLLYGLVAGWRWWAIVLVVAAEALLYPSAAALGVALVGARLLRLDRWPPRLDLDWRAWRAVVASGVVCLVVLAPTLLGNERFGPTVDAATARTMPEFGPGGRNAFFSPNPYDFWIESYRSGFDLRVTDARVTGLPLLVLLLALSGLLPVAALVRRRRGGSMALAPTAATIAQIVLASLALFFLAHLLLFELYLPSRFVAWTIPLAAAIGAGVGIVALVEAIVKNAPTPQPPRCAAQISTSPTSLRTGEGEQVSLSPAHGGGGWGVGAPILIALALALYPVPFDGNFVQDRTPEITAYLRSLPPDALVVGAPTDADSVPAFSGRRVLVNREYALAYHLGFYREVERRARDTIDAYYAESPRQVQEFATRYGVSVFLVNETAFDPATAADAWSGAFAPYTDEVVRRVENGRRFALQDAVRRCGAVTEGDVTAMSAACVMTLR